ncbi:unnamed protein product, partial [Tetraodon nigroviridis]
GPLRGPGVLAEKNQGHGDGPDSAGDLRALLHAHQLSPVGALPAVSPGGHHNPGGPGRLLRHVPGVLVCGEPELPPGPAGLLLWIIPVPEATVQCAQLQENQRVQQRQQRQQQQQRQQRYLLQVQQQSKHEIQPHRKQQTYDLGQFLEKPQQSVQEAVDLMEVVENQRGPKMGRRFGF